MRYNRVQPGPRGCITNKRQNPLPAPPRIPTPHCQSSANVPPPITAIGSLTCLRGALPPVDLRAVCFVLAIVAVLWLLLLGGSDVKFFKIENYEAQARCQSKAKSRR